MILILRYIFLLPTLAFGAKCSVDDSGNIAPREGVNKGEECTYIILFEMLLSYYEKKKHLNRADIFSISFSSNKIRVIQGADSCRIYNAFFL